MRVARKATATRPPTLLSLKPTILRICSRHGVRDVRICGSFVRGEQRNTSDIDLLIDPPTGMTLFHLSDLKLELEHALHRKVDIVPSRALKPALRERILAEARPL